MIALTIVTRVNVQLYDSVGSRAMLSSISEKLTATEFCLDPKMMT